MSQRIEQQAKLQEPKTLTRHWDTYGRDVGYSLDGERQTIVAYDPATGRIAGMDGFKWDYLPSSNLKSKLTYPNGAEVTWTYEPHRDLLTAVTNDTHSAYVYANDLLGRRVFKNDEHYGYNVRNELTSANAVSYAYDDIGNRTVAEGKTYTANNLNQYTQIDGFTPEYDADGNQTLIKTSTGIWSVTYNAENRPIRWESGDTVITMAFDRLGRRVSMRTVTPSSDLQQRFLYKDFLCIQQLRGPDNALYQSYVWDPTEPIATRPLIFLPASSSLAYYFHDGNKNVSDLVDIHGSVLHYFYTPFGRDVRYIFSRSGVLTSGGEKENPFLFSSEFHDNILGVNYYNYRHYNYLLGRWGSRDPLSERASIHLYGMGNNQVINYFDYLGGKALTASDCANIVELVKTKNKKIREMFQEFSTRTTNAGEPCLLPTIQCECCKNENGKKDSNNFSPNKNSIRLCYNNAKSATSLIESIAHELTHALDSCKGTNWKSCEERACSEIHAMDVAGSCRKGGKHRKKDESYRECIKRNAALSTRADKKCGDGTSAVSSVFERCFNEGK